MYLIVFALHLTIRRYCLFKVRRHVIGGINHDLFSSRPQFRDTYEVILLHPPSITLRQKFELLRESNLGPLNLESSAITS